MALTSSPASRPAVTAGRLSSPASRPAVTAGRLPSPASRPAVSPAGALQRRDGGPGPCLGRDALTDSDSASACVARATSIISTRFATGQGDDSAWEGMAELDAEVVGTLACAGTIVIRGNNNNHHNTNMSYG